MVEDLAEWAMATTCKRSAYHSCHTCRRTDASERLDEILEACVAAFDEVGACPSLPAVYQRLCEDVPSYAPAMGGLSETAMKSHVRSCRPDVYARLWAKQ